MEQRYNLSTYSDILTTLKEMEIEEDNFRQKRFWICAFSILVTILGLIIYASFQQRADVFFSGDTVKVLLIPLFSYLFMSFQEDLISERKSKLYESILNRFEPVKESKKNKKYINEAMDETEVKKIIQELIKSKLL